MAVFSTQNEEAVGVAIGNVLGSNIVNVCLILGVCILYAAWKTLQCMDFLPLIKRESTDERNFVRKAVNWALRNIGKRNPRLNKAAIQSAEKIRRLDSKAARWIAADALRELTSAAAQKRLQRTLPPF